MVEQACDQSTSPGRIDDEIRLFFHARGGQRLRAKLHTVGLLDALDARRAVYDTNTRALRSFENGGVEAISWNVVGVGGLCAADFVKAKALGVLSIVDEGGSPLPDAVARHFLFDPEFAEERNDRGHERFTHDDRRPFVSREQDDVDSRAREYGTRSSAGRPPADDHHPVCPLGGRFLCGHAATISQCLRAINEIPRRSLLPCPAWPHRRSKS